MLTAQSTNTLVHAPDTKGQRNTSRFLYRLVNQDGEYLINQDGQYLVATQTGTALVLHAPMTDTIVRAEET